MSDKPRLDTDDNYCPDCDDVHLPIQLASLRAPKIPGQFYIICAQEAVHGENPYWRIFDEEDVRRLPDPLPPHILALIGPKKRLPRRKQAFPQARPKAAATAAPAMREESKVPCSNQSCRSSRGCNLLCQNKRCKSHCLSDCGGCSVHHNPTQQPTSAHKHTHQSTSSHNPTQQSTPARTVTSALQTANLPANRTTSYPGSNHMQNHRYHPLPSTPLISDPVDHWKETQMETQNQIAQSEWLESFNAPLPTPDASPALYSNTFPQASQALHAQEARDIERALAESLGQGHAYTPQSGSSSTNPSSSSTQLSQTASSSSTTSSSATASSSTIPTELPPRFSTQLNKTWTSNLTIARADQRRREDEQRRKKEGPAQAHEFTLMLWLNTGIPGKGIVVDKVPDWPNWQFFGSSQQLKHAPNIEGIEWYDRRMSGWYDVDLDHIFKLSPGMVIFLRREGVVGLDEEKQIGIHFPLIENVIHLRTHLNTDRNHVRKGLIALKKNRPTPSHSSSSDDVISLSSSDEEANNSVLTVKAAKKRRKSSFSPEPTPMSRPRLSASVSLPSLTSIDSSLFDTSPFAFSPTTDFSFATPPFPFSPTMNSFPFASHDNMSTWSSLANSSPFSSQENMSSWSSPAASSSQISSQGSMRATSSSLTSSPLVSLQSPSVPAPLLTGWPENLSAKTVIDGITQYRALTDKHKESKIRSTNKSRFESIYGYKFFSATFYDAMRRYDIAGQLAAVAYEAGETEAGLWTTFASKVNLKEPVTTQEQKGKKDKKGKKKVVYKEGEVEAQRAKKDKKGKMKAVYQEEEEDN